MKLPPGVTVHKGVHVYRTGDDLPPELEAMLPEEVRLQALESETDPEPPRAVPVEPKPEAKRR